MFLCLAIYAIKQLLLCFSGEAVYIFLRKTFALKFCIKILKEFPTCRQILVKFSMSLKTLSETSNKILDFFMFLKKFVCMHRCNMQIFNARSTKFALYFPNHCITIPWVFFLNVSEKFSSPSLASPVQNCTS